MVALLVFGRDRVRPGRARPLETPVLAPPAPLNLPAIAKRSLSNGLAVWVVESHEVPNRPTKPRSTRRRKR